MGQLIDLHEVSVYRDWPNWKLIERYKTLMKLGLNRAAHPIMVEMHWRIMMIGVPKKEPLALSAPSEPPSPSA